MRKLCFSHKAVFMWMNSVSFTSQFARSLTFALCVSFSLSLLFSLSLPPFLPFQAAMRRDVGMKATQPHTIYNHGSHGCSVFLCSLTWFCRQADFDVILAHLQASVALMDYQLLMCSLIMWKYILSCTSNCIQFL